MSQDQFKKFREKLLDMNQEITAMIQQAQSVLGSGDAVFQHWNQICTNIDKLLMAHVLRIAVVGAIKSGKSTLVNSLLQNDYLKRGAGVVTSIVTRIRSGQKLRAQLFFKSWDEINTEIEQALVLFPSSTWRPDKNKFDIRRITDRTDLQVALGALDTESRLSRDHLDANGVLLNSYLKGFDRIEQYVTADNATQEFKGQAFAEHHAFVSDDALAVYLKDIQLEVKGDAIADNIEIADCQGSDSPNPLHLAMIQDYLLTAHMVIYVISSRTGLRQADIRFLSMIKRMGISDTILFVCNSDINEHESLVDLKTLISRIREELSLIIPQPRLFTISALWNLFTYCRTQLSTRDKARLSLWSKTKDLTTFLDKETQRLKHELEEKLTRERSALLLRNQLERLDVVATGLNQWVRLNRDLMGRDTNEAKTVTEQIQHHQHRIVQVQSMIQSTLNGAADKIKKELRRSIDRFFDRHSGSILNPVTAFIHNYRIDLYNYKEQFRKSGFTHTLYLVFQEFKQAVDAFLMEKVNPEIIGFINQQEEWLMNNLKTVAEPFEAMVHDVLIQYEEALPQFAAINKSGQDKADIFPDLANIKHIIGLALPPATAVMRYSAHIKTDAVIRLGFYTVVQIFRKALKKPISDDLTSELKALQDGVRRMKNETERSISAHFKDYQENIKFQYMFRLTDVATQRLFENLTELFQIHADDLVDLIDSISSQRANKEQVDEALIALEQAIDLLWKRIIDLRKRIIQIRNGAAGETDE